MKRLISLGLIYIILFTIIGCSSNPKDEINHSVLVIEGENNLTGKFGHFASNEYSVIKVEHITSLEKANQKYPDYDIQRAPAVFIFEIGGEMKKLKLKTYDVEEAIKFLEENSRKEMDPKAKDR
ncbi:hypothetical protein [Metabacillus litoralis]|uniref:hypothetical protein n=1 Tax=Metabacillus litoralis TaxID=152268 RepID=UPI001CFD2680|nr:hypothetical protein [Metabacillus litoralis]